MYLISLYFNEKTENRISGYMKQIAKYTGNTAMLDGNVPPHITIAAFHAESEEQAKQIFRNASFGAVSGKVHWVTLGSFLPNVIYIAPVLNEYLYGLSEIYNKEISLYKEIESDKRYQPLGWFPHTTLAKRLTAEQLCKGFEVMQKQFGPFEGQAVKVGLSKTNPYKDIGISELK